tara:strand:+ start:3459 stop:3740 length:282 start_codon:yes stop_codon:yes gene_type:complete
VTITLEVEHVTTVKLRLKIGDGWVSMLQSFSERAAIHAVARPTIRARPVLGAVASRARLGIRQGGEGAANRSESQRLNLSPTRPHCALRRSAI